MCNNYRLIERVPAEELFPVLEAPEGIPNFEPRLDIRITDRAPILRRGATSAVELKPRRGAADTTGGCPLRPAPARDAVGCWWLR